MKKRIIPVVATMRRALLAGGALLIFTVSQSALAADAPLHKSPTLRAPALFNWSGFYAGGHVGYGWGRGDDLASLTPVPAPFLASMRVDGWLGGIQAGYDARSGNWVAGVLADISATNMHGNAFVGPFLPVPGGGLAGGSSHTASQTIDWFGTLRARVGVAPTDRLLAFVSGGLAYGRVKFAGDTFFGPFITRFAASESKWKAGWTVGAGFEWAIGSGWSMLADYLYYDLGRTTVIANPVPAGLPNQFANEWKTNGHIVRLGLNYRFGGPM